MPERTPVRKSQRGSPDHRGMEDRLQHQSTAHEPRRAHTDRVCNPPQEGPITEQSLLINGGKLGSRSLILSHLKISLEILLTGPLEWNDGFASLFLEYVRFEEERLTCLIRIA